jgi:uncharacterized protein (UPF0303 family)
MLIFYFKAKWPSHKINFFENKYGTYLDNDDHIRRIKTQDTIQYYMNCIASILEISQKEKLILQFIKIIDNRIST